LKTLYGNEGYRNLLSGSEIQIFLPPRDYSTATEIAELAGRRTILTASYSSSAGGRGRPDSWGGVSYGEAAQDVLTPHDVMALGPDKFIMIAPGLVPDVAVVKRKNYWDYSEIASRCDPNPYAPGYRKRHNVLAMEARAKQTMPESLQSKYAKWRRGRRA
jgi:type IV secretory pathway TraG/TraD family ATPase VirD4